MYSLQGTSHWIQLSREERIDRLAQRLTNLYHFDEMTHQKLRREMSRLGFSGFLDALETLDFEEEQLQLLRSFKEKCGERMAERMVGIKQRSEVEWKYFWSS